ncbi:hypothetical protein RISK_000394 [Rhodopirellula islandica]|uniref:Uncharacterized protein n=1 Tax=Rhodopirellula islandica TaxID=595434 RepID=A0A0J1BLA6_RHOIS|nr:hypothetical protein RISK_000394 [Rhodopirellula islandica]
MIRSGATMLPSEGEWKVDGALHALIAVEGQELEMRIMRADQRGRG